MLIVLTFYVYGVNIQTSAEVTVPQNSIAQKKKHRKSAPRYHHGDLRSSLISVAAKLLAANSPEQISLRDLARHAGVSAAAPYRHFKDKRDLLAAIVQQGFELKYSYMAKAVQKNLNDPQELYFQIGLAYFRMGRLHPQHFKLMMTSEILPSEEFPGLLMAATKAFRLLKEVVMICQHAKVIGSGDPYHKAMNCWCVVAGFTALYAEGHLQWLGVSERTSESALKTLLAQYLLGTKQPIKEHRHGFSPFATKESDLFKKSLLESPDPEIDRLFKR